MSYLNLKALLQHKIKLLVSRFQYDSSSSRSSITTGLTKHFKHLRSFNTPLCNTSPILFLLKTSPIETTKNQPEQMDTNHTTSKSSDTDEKPTEQSISTPPPSKKKYDIMKDPIFLTSPLYPSVISPKDSIPTQRDDYLNPILSTENFTFKSQLTSLYMHPTDYTFKLYDKNQDVFTSIASKIVTPYHNWLDNLLKIFSLQFNFLRPSIYDLKTEEDDPSFLSLSQQTTPHTTYTTFLKHQKPKNYISVNYIYTSPFNTTHLYTIDHSRITGYIRNYDPIKQYFCLLPYNDTSRPVIVPQEHLIHFEDFLLPCNVLTIIPKPLTVIKHFVSTPLTDKEKSFYTALSKQSYSYKELLFIPAKVIAFMVKAEKARSETQYTNPEQYTPKPPTTTTDKLNNVLTSRTLRDLTYKLDPYKRIPHILHLQHSHTFLDAMTALSKYYNP